MPFFIHIADPQFAVGQGKIGNEEFPFGRRFGPYLSQEEALNQIVSDVAGGLTRIEDVLGIFSEEDSESQRFAEEGKKAPKSSVATSQIEKLAEKERDRREQERVDRLKDSHPEHDEMWASLEAAVNDPDVALLVKRLREGLKR